MSEKLTKDELAEVFFATPEEFADKVNGPAMQAERVKRTKQEMAVARRIVKAIDALGSDAIGLTARRAMLLWVCDRYGVQPRRVM